MTPISPHFSFEELTITQQTGPDGKILPNVPDANSLDHLNKLANTILEPIRDLWGCPVQVTSAFRCREVEIKVSGKAYGQHMLGQAADILPIGDKLSLIAAYELIWRSNLPYDQLLLEQAGSVRWIHVSCSPNARRMALFSPDNGKSWQYYQSGIVT